MDPLSKSVGRTHAKSHFNGGVTVDLYCELNLLAGHMQNLMLNGGDLYCELNLLAGYVQSFMFDGES